MDRRIETNMHKIEPYFLAINFKGTEAQLSMHPLQLILSSDAFFPWTPQTLILAQSKAKLLLNWDINIYNYGLKQKR